MKQKVFTKSMQILIVSLIILAVIIPRNYSQKAMVVALFLWFAFISGRFLWSKRSSLSSTISGKKIFFKRSHESASAKTVFACQEKDPGKAESDFSLTTQEVEAMLHHLSLRITEKLKSAYPQAVWQWAETPSLHQLLAGTTVRIAVEEMSAFTHADITFDRFGRIHVEPMTIGNFFLENPDEDVSDTDISADPPVVDVRAWFELIGQRILDAQITELNANGHSQLTIKENGDIVIKRQKKEAFVASFESFPGRNYWEELVTVLAENELNAKISGNNLQVSWI